MSGISNSLTNYRRRKTETVCIGQLKIGSKHPIVVQSMVNTDTQDTAASVEQSIKIIEAGGEMVRFTVPTLQDTENLKNIKASLLEKGYSTPLVADVHFQPKAAMLAAQLVEKVRINPGNLVPYQKEDAFETGLKKLEEQFFEFLSICKKNGTAIRVGVNHGSLSQRILNKYGNTPKGMVESAMELLRICQKESFSDVVVSMKSSNTRVMVQAYRLLVDSMQQEQMQYPIHLGVTEAGDDKEGRIKSAVGIGSLLVDGIGDTLRVSLTENPENEIPVAKKLCSYFENRSQTEALPEIEAIFNPFEYQRNATRDIDIIGSNNAPVVIASKTDQFEMQPDFIGNINNLTANDSKEEIPVFHLVFPQLQNDQLEKIKSCPDAVIVAKATGANPVGEWRVLFAALKNQEIKNPVVLKKSYRETESEDFIVKAAADFGAMFIDGLGDGIWIENENLPENIVVETAFDILQASRARISKTDYIACPSCGRTKFDIQAALQEVKRKTSHLKGLKIAVMGCIVNGPGEMVDADYGYVGAGPGKVYLYKGKNLIKKNLPEESAIEELLKMIEKDR